MVNESAESLENNLNKKPRRSSSRSATGEPKESLNEFIQGVSSSKGRFIVVEGPQDKRFYEEWCAKNNINNITIREVHNISVRSIRHDCLSLRSGRTQVISVSMGLSNAHKSKSMRLEADSLKDKILCIADRDLGAGVIEFEDLQREFLVYTDFPALESYFLTVSNIEYFLKDYLSSSFKGDIISELEEIFKELFIFWNLRSLPGHPNQSFKYKNLKGRRNEEKNKDKVNSWIEEFQRIGSDVDKRSFCYGHDISALIYDRYTHIQNCFASWKKFEDALLEQALSDDSLKNEKLFCHIISKYGSTALETRPYIPMPVKSSNSELEKALLEAGGS